MNFSPTGARTARPRDLKKLRGSYLELVRGFLIRADGPSALRTMRFLLVLLIGLNALHFGHSAEVVKAPVPKSPYLPVVYRYADTMIERGRDTFGSQKTGLFLSGLDRTTLAPLTNRPAAPSGVREGDRAGAPGGPLVGANPQHDENLLRLLYLLSELSAKPKYRAAADGALKWFLQNAATPATHLLPWGVHSSWNVMTDEPNGKRNEALHDFVRPWMLWDRCFEIAPEPSRQYALGLWKVGDDTQPPQDFRRQAGFSIRTWAVAHAQTKDERFLTAIEDLLEWFRHGKSGPIEVYTGQMNTAVASMLSLAIDCDGAAHRVPKPLAGRLRVFAAREDEMFCALPHSLKATGSFVTEIDVKTGESKARPRLLWDGTTAQIGMMCVSRYDNAGRVAYRDLITAAADAYLDTAPTEAMDTWPMTFGHVISLELAAWRHTARPVYLECARRLGDLAVEKFWGTNALPRASLKTDHYESITGADTLALALVELHLNILHITAVRCPPNTIDR